MIEECLEEHRARIRWKGGYTSSASILDAQMRKFEKLKKWRREKPIEYKNAVLKKELDMMKANKAPPHWLNRRERKLREIWEI